MSRRDCLRQVIKKYMNADIRRMVVPSALNGVLPDGTTLDGLIDKLGTLDDAVAAAAARADLTDYEVEFMALPRSPR